MPIGEELKKKLSKTYQPSSMVEMEFKGNDISFKTDPDGNPILLFIGKRDESGTIKGNRFTRTLKRDAAGQVIKDHWDLKGKAT